MGCYFIHTLDEKGYKALKKELGSNKAKVLYVEKRIKAGVEKKLLEQFELEYVNFNRVEPKVFINFSKKLFEATEELFADEGFTNRLSSLERFFEIGREHLELCFKKASIVALENDFKLIYLAGVLLPGEKITYLVNDKSLLSCIYKDLALLEIGSEGKQFNRFMGYFPYLLKKIVFNGEKKNTFAIKGGIIWEQTYRQLDVNTNEFNAIYRYFQTRTDVIYSCADTAGRYQFLRKEGKPAIVFRWWVKSWSNKIKILKSFFGLWGQLIKGDESLFFKNSLLYLWDKERLYSCLFHTYRPGYIVKTRSEFSTHHPLITAFAEKYGAKHIGYQHAHNPYIQAIIAYADYHVFGVLGKNYAHNISKYVGLAKVDKFLHLGPFMPALERSGKTLASGQEERNLNVGILPTGTFGVHDIQSDFYAIFIGVCYKTFDKRPFNLYLHEKGYDEKYCSVENEIRKKYNLNLFKSYTKKTDVPETNTVYETTSGVYEKSDIIIIMIHSTVAWEALSFKKKLIVFEIKGFEHPFEKYLPQLVVRSEDEFNASLNWLLSISQDEYEKMIEPLMNDWCKVNDGNLFKSFWEEVEATAPPTFS